MKTYTDSDLLKVVTAEVLEEVDYVLAHPQFPVRKARRLFREAQSLARYEAEKARRAALTPEEREAENEERRNNFDGG